MPLTLDLSDNYLVYDERETITLVSMLNGRPDGSAQEVTNTVRLPFDERELAASLGVYQSLDRKWLLPGALMSGRVPKIGDKIRANSPGTSTTADPSALGVEPELWTVLSINQYDPVTKEWELATRNMALANDLRQTIVFEWSKDRQDKAGAMVRDWLEAYRVRGRLQVISATAGDEQNKRYTLHTATVYVEETLEQLEPSTDWRCWVEEARPGTGGQRPVWDVTGWTNPERIDQLMEVQVKRSGK